MPYAPQSHKPRHARTATKRRDHRASSADRGYDSDWAKVRRCYVMQHPLCEHCLAQDRITPCHEVDHVIPITGPHDPLRLDTRNLQSLCRRHHALKTSHDADIRTFYDMHGMDAALNKYRGVAART